MLEDNFLPDSINELSEGVRGEIEARRQREIDRFKTRYVFLPLIDAPCSAIPGGYVPSMRIVPIEPPERRDHRTNIADPSVIIRYEGKEGQIAVYLDDPGAIVSGIVAYYHQDGATEIKALEGMPVSEFNRYRMNRVIFGDQLPKSSKATRERMDAIIAQSVKNNDPAHLTLKQIATEILDGISRAELSADDQLRATHQEMDLARSGNPDAKPTYSKRDHRALEFLQATPRDQALNHLATQHNENAAALPAILNKFTELEQRWATMGDAIVKIAESVGTVVEKLTATATVNSVSSETAKTSKK